MKTLLSVFLMTLATIGCAPADRTSTSIESSNENANFARASEDFERAIKVSDRLSEAGMPDLGVDSQAGQITLCGSVEHVSKREEAEQIARNVDGVVRVDNRILVGKKPPVNTNKPGGPRVKPCE